MKKIIFTFISFLFIHSLFAQNNIKNEIFAFTDTTETILRNGRKLIVEKTISGDHKGAISTLNFLKNNTEDKYLILYPAEEILISLANRSFPLFLHTAANYTNLIEGKTRIFQFEPILPDIHSYLGDEMNFIAEELQNSNLNASEIEFIQLYIRFYQNEDKALLNKAIKTYEKENPDTEYVDFLKELKQLTQTGRMNFCIGYGQEFLGGNMANNFTNHLHIVNIEYDGFINNVYVSVFMGGSVNKVYSTDDLPVKKKSWIHSQNQPVSSLKYGAKFGHSIYRKERINLYPFVSIGGYEMNSQSDEFEDNSDEPKNNLSGSFMSGLGASCDFILKKWNSKYAYDPVGYIILRPTIGYDYFFSSKEISKGSDLYFTLSLGISLGGNNY
jgi:hypothetical protein